jgi:hypothetical protein
VAPWETKGVFVGPICVGFSIGRRLLSFASAPSHRLEMFGLQVASSAGSWWSGSAQSGCPSRRRPAHHGAVPPLRRPRLACCLSFGNQRSLTCRQRSKSPTKICWSAHAVAVQWHYQFKRQPKGPSVKQQSNQGICRAHTVAPGLSLTVRSSRHKLAAPVCSLRASRCGAAYLVS